MAQGLIRSDATRDGIAAVLAVNLGNLEDEMYERREQWDAEQTAIQGMMAALEEGGLRRLNGPNLLTQPQFVTASVPATEVVTETLSVPAEDAAAAAEPLTFTVTDENITANSVLHGVWSSNWDVVSRTTVTAVCSAGSAAVTIAARPDAHSGAVTVKVFICEEQNKSLPYGETARAFASSQPFLDSVRGADYIGEEQDEISEEVVTLTGNDIVTEQDGTVYSKAIAFTVTNPPSNGWGNADKMVFNEGNRTVELEDGEPKHPMYGELDMTVGERYTLSCWARVTSGDKAMLWLGACAYNHQEHRCPDCWEYHEIDANGGEWQRVIFEFVFNPEGSQFYTYTNGGVTYRGCYWTKSVGIGVCRKYAGTVQLCGFRLVHGKMWVSDTFADLEDQLTDARAEIRKRIPKNPLETGEGTAGSAGSASAAYVPSLWTFDLDLNPTDGDVVFVKVPVAGVNAGVWLSTDGGINYYPVAVSGTSILTTHFVLDAPLMLMFETGRTTNIYGTDQTGAAAGASTAAYEGGRWCVLNYYNTNTTYSAATQAILTAGTSTTNRVIPASVFKPSVIAIAEAAAATAAETEAVITEYGQVSS